METQAIDPQRHRTKNLPDIIFVTGMSGAGRSSALKIFENLGYATIDNLPSFMLEQFYQGLVSGKLQAPLVVGFNVRSFNDEDQQFEVLLETFRQKFKVRLLFLDCQNDILLKRYNVSRQLHPFGDKNLLEGIERERDHLNIIREQSDHVIDTSVISVVTLGRVLRNIFARAASPKLQIRLMSFSYRRGLPPEADMILDARFLENPHYEEHLQPLTGKDKEVADFIQRDLSWSPVFLSIKQMLFPMITGFKQSGRTYLTIAVGCTGGQHRSVFCVEQLSSYLQELGENVYVEHRELDK